MVSHGNQGLLSKTRTERGMNISNTFNPGSQKSTERSVGRQRGPAGGWILTRRLKYRDDTLTNARCLSERLVSPMLPPHVLENGNDVPIPSPFADVGFRLC
jgi:hypothetical protein